MLAKRVSLCVDGPLELACRMGLGVWCPVSGQVMAILFILSAEMCYQVDLGTGNRRQMRRFSSAN